MLQSMGLQRVGHDRAMTINEFSGFGLEWKNCKVYLRLKNDICIPLLHTFVYIYIYIDR